MVNEDMVRKQAAADNITHLATGVAVLQGGKLLVVRRVVEDDTLGGEWELPGGGVDPGETIEQGAIRELLEETGLEVSEVVGTFAGFDYSTSKKPRVRQINFKVTAMPGDIKLEPTEHNEYRWITANDIPSLEATKEMQVCLHDALN